MHESQRFGQHTVALSQPHPLAMSLLVANRTDRCSTDPTGSDAQAGGMPASQE